MVLKFIIVAIIAIGFIGLGGLESFSAFGQKTKEQFFGGNGTIITEDGSIITNDSEAKAIIDDTEIPETPKETKSKEKAQAVSESFTQTKSNQARIASDIAALEARKGRARKPFLKKSGAEVVREKERQEQLANIQLKKTGATFSGRGKFGRPKLFANPNFDLGLPSSATKADRDKVIREKALRSGRSRARRLEKRKTDILTRTLSRKSESELLKIAALKGFKFGGRITASNLAKILVKTGGS